MLRRAFIALLFLCTAGDAAAAPLTWLSEDSAYLRSAPRTDYWVVSRSYMPQPTSSSSGVACAATLKNAIQFRKDPGYCGSLVTPKGVMKKNSAFANAGKEGGDGMDLDTYVHELKAELNQGTSGEVRVQTHRFDQGPAAVARQALVDLLARNESSQDDFLVANYLQGLATGDPDGMVGHFSPIAAYDAAEGRVLILDTDEENYAPYWIDVDTLLRAINTLDDSVGKSRGLVEVSLQRP